MYVRLLSRLRLNHWVACVGGLFFESVDWHHIYMPWSFLISFRNTSLIAGLPLLFPCCLATHHFGIIISDKPNTWLKWFAFAPAECYGCHPHHLFLQLIVQFNSLSIKSIIVRSNFSCSAVLSMWLNIFGELMLSIWQVKRKMDIRWAMQRFPIWLERSCWHFFPLVRVCVVFPLRWISFFSEWIWFSYLARYLYRNNINTESQKAFANGKQNFFSSRSNVSLLVCHTNTRPGK